MKVRGSILLGSMITLACAFIILLPTIINGYPFVYADTGTYIRSAFEGYVPIDRPYWYGVFMRITSLGGHTLWGVAVAQALFCASYVRRVCACCSPSQRPHRTALIGSAVLTLCTGLGWYAGQLLPDVFTGVGLLAVYLLVRSKGAWWVRVWDLSVITMACWMHLSNLLILPVAGLVLLLVGRRASLLPRRSGLALIGTATVLAWGGLALANRVVDGKAYISRSGHIFFMGRMIDLGMLEPYLEEHCPAEHYGICAYKNDLPANSASFLWGSDSPVAKQGGWEATREEYGRIVRSSFLEPHYLWWHVRGSFISTAEQLCAWRICTGLESDWYRTPDSPPYGMIGKFMPQDWRLYLGSMQNGGRGELRMRWPDRIYQLVLACSLLAACWLLFGKSRPEGDNELRVFLLHALVAIVIGAAVCASLSVVDTRYLGRDSWLLPFAIFLFAAARLERTRVAKRIARS